MIAHNLIFVSGFLGELEKQPVFELGVLIGFLGLDLGLFEFVQSIETASFVCVKISIVVIPFHKIIVYVHRLLIITIMERAISDAHVGFQIVSLRVLSVTL